MHPLGAVFGVVFALVCLDVNGQFNDYESDFGPMRPPPPWWGHFHRRHHGPGFCWRHPDHPRCWNRPSPWGRPPFDPWRRPPPFEQDFSEPEPPVPAPTQPPVQQPPQTAPPILQPPPTTAAPLPPPTRAPILSPPVGGVPRGPPASLMRVVRDVKFGHLESAPRQTLINSCTRVNCQAQPPAAVQKRSQILRSEVSIQRKLSPSLTSSQLEARLNRVQQVKQELLATSGLGSAVTSANDGTFEEDVLLSDSQSSALLNSLRQTRGKRSIIYGEDFPVLMWNKGYNIPYAFDVSVLPADQAVIRGALNEIESKTCIRFQYYSRRPAFNHIYYAKIDSSSFCGLSYIGRASPANPIYLSFRCPDFTGIIVHETLHALGVIHQHLRSDRDQHVKMEWQNMNPQYYDQYAVADPKMFSSYGVPYDYYSIMHYNAFVAALDPRRPTMTPLTQTQRFLQVLGQRKKLSDRDVELLNALYCTSKGCVDRNVYCGVWALQQLCTSKNNGGWLRANCQKSCGFCK